MSLRRAKIFLIIAIMFLIFFFSNDFGLIDIEKTAIITAVAIDYGENAEYKVTAQIAVPEASDVSSENAKSHVAGTGATVGSAIKNVGDTSGWFPNLSFCNLIIIGKEMAEDNIITVLDYFTKTLRIQDSALVVLADDKAETLIQQSTPLDNISSFALQKILLKNPGHDRDTATVDIKTFCVGYYSDNASSFMPIIKTVDEESQSGGAPTGEQDGGASGSGGGSGLGALGNSTAGTSGSDSGLDGKGKATFDARTTALFKNGKKVGELTPETTFIFNALTKSVNATTFEVNDVPWGTDTKNFLLTFERASPKITLSADINELKLDVALDIYCRITDQNTEDSEYTYTKNNPLPLSVKERATEIIRGQLTDLIDTMINTECDILKLQPMLYRYHHKYYNQYKDSLFSSLVYTTSVTVNGQK